MFMLKLVGYRTYIVSALCGIMAIMIQADVQGVLNLAPMVKLCMEFGLVVLLPFVPIFLRRGIEDMLNKKKEEEAGKN